MTATVIPIGSAPKLRGQEPSCGWGFYVDSNGVKSWLYETRDGGEAIKRWQQLEDSGWWDNMNRREQAAFHAYNSHTLDAKAALDYRRYLEYVTMPLEQSDDQADKMAPAKNKTPSGANR